MTAQEERPSLWRATEGNPWPLNLCSITGGPGARYDLFFFTFFMSLLPFESRRQRDDVSSAALPLLFFCLNSCFLLQTFIFIWIIISLLCYLMLCSIIVVSCNFTTSGSSSNNPRRSEHQSYYQSFKKKFKSVQWEKKKGIRIKLGSGWERGRLFLTLNQYCHIISKK